MIESRQGILLAMGNFPEGNATATRINFIARALAAGGMPVKVALLQATLKHQMADNNAVSGVIDGIHFEYLNGRTVRPGALPAAILDTLRGIAGALKLLFEPDGKERTGFVLFYTPSLLRHGLPMLAAMIMRIPVFVEVCEIRSKTTSAIKLHALGRMLKFTEIAMEWLSPRIARGIIPISHRIADFYRQKGVADDKLFLLPILVDAGMYSEPSCSEVPVLVGKRYFLNSGSFVEKDGVEYIVESFIQVARENLDICIVFTGNVSEQDQEKVRDTLSSGGVAGRALFVGMLSRAKLIWAYQHAVGLLCCRTNSPYANFGFPTKLAEYLATGAPVIATRVGDTEYYLTHEQSALLAEPENVFSIASCMKYVVENPDLVKSIGLHGQLVAREQFHYEQYAQPLAQFIRARSGSR